MLTSRVVTACRLSSSVANESKTHVVLLHLGQPRSEYYAKLYAADAAAAYYNIPDSLKCLASTPFLVDDKVRKCISEYGKRESIEATLERLCRDVEEDVNKVVPEFGRVHCSSSFLFDNNSIEKNLEKIISCSPSRVVFLPLYAHFNCAQSGVLLNAVAKYLYEKSVPMIENGRSNESVRVLPGSATSFEVSAIHRFGDHPILSNLWYSLLKDAQCKYDAVSFAAPDIRGYGAEEYRNQVWATCERVMGELSFSVPWTVGYYNGWDQWRIPMKRNIYLKTRSLIGKVPNERRVALVPITHFVPTFDTFSVLPEIVKKMPKCFLLSPSSHSSLLSQGLAELVKNHLLGRRNAQLQIYCGACIRKECEYTRLLLSQKCEHVTFP